MSRRAENCGVPQLQFLDKVDMPVVVNDRLSEVPQVQFCGCGRPCDHAATSGLVLEVPLILFIARAGGHPVVQQRLVLDLAVMAAVGGGFSAALTHFSRSSGFSRS